MRKAVTVSLIIMFCIGAPALAHSLMGDDENVHSEVMTNSEGGVADKTNYHAPNSRSMP